MINSLMNWSNTRMEKNMKFSFSESSNDGDDTSSLYEAVFHEMSEAA